MNESIGTFKFDKDTKRMHRFQVVSDEVTGTLYIPKDAPGIPRRIVLENARYKESIREEETDSD